MTDAIQPEPQTIDRFWIRDLDIELVRFLCRGTPFYGLSIRAEAADHDDPDEVIHLNGKQLRGLSTALERVKLTMRHDRKQFPDRDTISDDEILAGLAGKDGDPEALRRQLEAEHQVFLHGGIPGWSPPEEADAA